MAASQPEETSELLCLKPGTYSAIYVAHQGMHVFRSPKLRVDFRLLEHLGLVLPRWYHVTGYKHRVSAPVHSDLVREVSAVLNVRVRHDRIPVASLAEIPVRVTVATVKRDQRQNELAEVNQYSVISRVDGRL
jgi:hypothetical protein